MRIADVSVQKMAITAYESKNGTGTEILYLPDRLIGLEITERYPSYKILFVTDDVEKVSFLSFLPSDTLSCVWTKPADVRYFFAFPENINLVVIFGGEELIESARYFASIRGIKCVVICTSADCKGIFSETVKVNIFDEVSRFPAEIPELLFFDEKNIAKEGIKSAYVDLAVHSAVLVEKKFSRLVLEKRIDDELYDLALDNYLNLTDITASFNPIRSLFEQCFRSEYLRRKGFYDTESCYLWDNLNEREKFAAFDKITELFTLFFRYGRKRKSAAPDYIERFRNAASIEGKSEFYISERCFIPSWTELGNYDEAMYRNRVDLLSFSEDLKRRKQNILDAYCRFGGTACEAYVSPVLIYLPELSGKYGIMSLMRDFGLLERK